MENLFSWGGGVGGTEVEKKDLLHHFRKNIFPIFTEVALWPSGKGLKMSLIEPDHSKHGAVNGI
jgi:hypothetical protein